MIRKVTRIRCDECFLEFERDQIVCVLNPPMVYINGGLIEHVCKSCYERDCLGLDYERNAEEYLTKKWKEENE